jgi:hypothetical protein
VEECTRQAGRAATKSREGKVISVRLMKRIETGGAGAAGTGETSKISMGNLHSPLLISHRLLYECNVIFTRAGRSLQPLARWGVGTAQERQDPLSVSSKTKGQLGTDRTRTLTGKRVTKRWAPIRSRIVVAVGESRT